MILLSLERQVYVYRMIFFQGSRLIWFCLVHEQKVQWAAKIPRFTVPGEQKAKIEPVMLGIEGGGWNCEEGWEKKMVPG